MKRIVRELGKLNWAKRAFAVFVLCAMTAIALAAQTFTTLYSFDGTDGSGPVAGLVQATNGDLYGTTTEGGANLYGGVYGGTVFKITPSGTLTTLYSFCSESGCTDGEFPYAGLVQAANGDLYGTTEYGGANPIDEYGGGTVFKITPGGTLTTLYSFDGTDGEFPYAGLVQATNGDLYGTTTHGGTSGGGTVFKITPGGTLTTLYNFCSQTNCADGEYPYGGLVQARNGDLYGTTSGGANSVGTIFKITPSGTLTTLYSFCPNPSCYATVIESALIQATNGNLYGTTEDGGDNGLVPGGSVFKITPSGTLTTLHGFCCAEGGGPTGALVQATDGNFYGTTVGRGTNGQGKIFEITPGGTLTTLYNFCSQKTTNCADGANPYAGLVQATNGDLYGTTAKRGVNGYGTVFSLSVGLGPFVKTLPTRGFVGEAVKILGTDLTGATSVTFNGTPATFTVVQPSEITATVPTGATTGTVQVVTPSGTLSSNVSFDVVL